MLSTTHTSAARRRSANVIVLVALSVLMTGCMLFARPPKDLDYSRIRASEGGAYRATIRPQGDSIPNTGVPFPATALPPDSGRLVGVRQALGGEFNCTSRYSDAKLEDCQELHFAVTEGEALVRA